MVEALTFLVWVVVAIVVIIFLAGLMILAAIVKQVIKEMRKKDLE